MRIVVASLFAAAALAAPATAVTFFSVGGAPDPGIAPFETTLVSFDAPLHAGVSQADTGPVALYTGSSGQAAAPAGDTSTYMGIGTDGRATFDFRDYFASRSSPARSLSVYLGSIDSYNFIDVLDAGLNVVATISGTDLPASNGDQGAAITNRRLFINFDPSEAIGGLAFRSTGVAFEFDGIAASAARYQNFGDPTPFTIPFATAVPEPATWALLLAGFGFIGTSLRRRRNPVVTA